MALPDVLAVRCTATLTLIWSSHSWVITTVYPLTGVATAKISWNTCRRLVSMYHDIGAGGGPDSDSLAKVLEDKSSCTVGWLLVRHAWACNLVQSPMGCADWSVLYLRRLCSCSLDGSDTTSFIAFAPPSSFPSVFGSLVCCNLGDGSGSSLDSRRSCFRSLLHCHRGSDKRGFVHHAYLCNLVQGDNRSDNRCWCFPFRPCLYEPTFFPQWAPISTGLCLPFESANVAILSSAAAPDVIAAGVEFDVGAAMIAAFPSLRFCKPDRVRIVWFIAAAFVNDFFTARTGERRTSGALPGELDNIFGHDEAGAAVEEDD